MSAMAESSVGQIEYLRGDVEVWRGDKKMPATNELKVFAGDKVITKQGARIRIRFVDESSMQMGENAQSSIRHYKVEEGMVNVFLELIAGRARFMIMKLKEADASYQVKMRAVLIGVRGTDILAQAGNKEHIALVHGRINLSDQLGGTLNLEPDSYIATSDKLPKQAQPIPYPWLEAFIQDVGTSDEGKRAKPKLSDDEDNPPAEVMRSQTIQGLDSPAIIPR